MSASPVTGALPLLRAELKHGGRLLAPWVLLATLLSSSSVIVYPWLFPEQHDRAALALAISSNPALGLIFGHAGDLTTTDGFNAWRSLAIGDLLAAIGAIFAITRTTRAQEDSGQAELLASGVMGRGARLTAAVAMGLGMGVVLGLVTGLVTVAFGGGWEASMLLAATMTVTGWMLTGVSAIAAQLGSDARTANTLAASAFGILFMARGFAFSIEAPDWVQWANPLGWMSQTLPATENRWWPLLLGVGLMVVLVAVAFVLQTRRDFGVGAIAPRPGPARGRQRSVWGLALRLNRGPMITWAVAFAALAVVYGYFTTSVPDLLGDDSAVQQILAAGAATREELIGSFVVMILSLVGILAAVPGVQTMLRVRAEEVDDRVEPILATAVSRPKYYASNVVIALVGPAVFVVIAGTIVAALASSADIGLSFGDVLRQSVSTIPAVLTVVAVAVAVVGARPAVPPAAWAGVLLSFGLTLLGPSFKLPDWALGISPFWHVPNVMSADPDWWGLLWVSLVALLLLAVGFAGFRRRDLARQ